MAPSLRGGRPGTQGNTEWSEQNQILLIEVEEEKEKDYYVLPTSIATMGAIVLQKTNIERLRAPLSLGLVPARLGEEEERVTKTL